MNDHVTQVNIAIQDAGVMVDLSRAGLVSRAFELPVTYYTADSVLDDLSSIQRNEFYPYIETTQLRCESLDAVMFSTIAKYQHMYPELSEQDLSVYHIAQTKKLPVLTSCNTLRLFMKKLQVDARSTYWIVDLLADYSFITAQQAGVLYQKLNTANPRLAPEDFSTGQNKWQK